MHWLGAAALSRWCRAPAQRRLIAAAARVPRGAEAQGKRARSAAANRAPRAPTSISTASTAYVGCQPAGAPVTSAAMQIPPPAVTCLHGQPAPATMGN